VSVVVQRRPAVSEVAGNVPGEDGPIDFRERAECEFSPFRMLVVYYMIATDEAAVSECRQIPPRSPDGHRRRFVAEPTPDRSR
jgi:hypothetical protein